MMKKRAAAVLLLMMAVGCKADNVDSARNIAGASGAGTGAAGMAGAAGMVGGAGAAAGSGGSMGQAKCTALTGDPPAPTFSWFFKTVTPSCAGPLCHTGTAGGGLKFETMDAAYDLLMMPAMGMNLGQSTSATNCKQTMLTRVVPGNPDASLLYAKLRTDKDPPCGNRMPTNGMLCPDAIEAIRMWIASGAAKN